MMHLRIGSSLQGGKYKIEKVLGQGGFGITYLATQELLNRKVCIKEFFFKEYCERDTATSHVSLGTQSNHEIVERFMNKFLKEARTISQLEHPNIIRIHDTFKENNTAYYVMEYIEGESLSDRVNHSGALSESDAVDYIKQVALALNFIHQRSINHLDVKPANIMIRKMDNKAILIDFGLSKQYDTKGGQTSTTPVGISHGYAPMEQYNEGGVSTFSPQTDIYSLGATLYKLVTGNTPPPADYILNDGFTQLPSFISSNILNAITKSMQSRKRDRPQNIEDFLGYLKNVDTEKKCNNSSEEETTLIFDEIKKDLGEKIAIKYSLKNKFIHYKKIILTVCTIVVVILAYFITKPSSQDLYEKASIYISKYNYEEAVPLLKKAADLGNDDAQLSLSVCLATGNGIEKDTIESFKWALKAAEQGNVIAQFHVGMCYYEGSGVDKNHLRAKEWLQKSASKGYEAAKGVLDVYKFDVE